MQKKAFFFLLLFEDITEEYLQLFNKCSAELKKKLQNLNDLKVSTDRFERRVDSRFCSFYLDKICPGVSVKISKQLIKNMNR